MLFARGVDEQFLMLLLSTAHGSTNTRGGSVTAALCGKELSLRIASLRPEVRSDTGTTLTSLEGREKRAPNTKIAATQQRATGSHQHNSLAQERNITAARERAHLILVHLKLHT